MKIKVLFYLFIFSFSVIKTKNISVLFVLNRFPAPTKSIIINQMNALSSKNHIVHIYANEKEEEFSNDPILKQYKVFFEQMPKDLSIYDIIFVQYGNLAQEFIDIKKNETVNWKLVVYFRGGDITTNENCIPGQYDSLFKYSDLILTVCDYYKYRLLSVLNCPKNKVKVIPSAIDCSFFEYKVIPKNKKVIHLLSVGRLIEKKGMEFIIKAINIISKKGYLVRLDIIGEGKRKGYLKRLVKRFNLEKNITFHGWKNQYEIRQYLEDCHIFILPSVTSQHGTQEGIANALKEAMAIGRPVIATYHAGTQELVDNEINGFLVPERSVKDIVKKLIILIKDLNLSEQMGINGRKKVITKYSIDTINELLVNTLVGL